MSAVRLILASLFYHARQNLAVALGVAAGTAVLTGALLVGDSMRGSLRHLTFDRLGRIDYALVSPHFFHAQAAADLAAQPEFQKHFSAAVPAVVLQASLESANPRHPLRANRVQLLGCPDAFWDLGPARPATLPGPRQVVLNQPLADQLGVKVGDPVLVRLPMHSTIPADTALGRKHGTVEAYRVTVAAIIPAQGLGRFSLQPTQQVVRNAYLPVDWLQQRLDRAGRANAIFVASRDGSVSPEADAALHRLWKPTLDDGGIRLDRTDRGYFNLSSERMLLDPAVEKSLMEKLQGETLQPSLTYLANTIACGKREIPYSTITAVDFAAQPPLGPMLTSEGKPIAPLADDQIALNRWAADDLKARPGDVIHLTFFEPETTHGQARERTVDFRLAAVVELTGAAADRAFTPDVPGITDQRTMSDWDAPFPFAARRVRTQDDRYWESHRATPKAFVSLATGRRLWANRFGQTTTIRIQPREGMTRENLADRLTLAPDVVGLSLQPVKQLGLLAAHGTTPFNVLFLAFSSFIIAAAVMLVALLFRLAIDNRAQEIGTLLAVGFRPRQISRMLAAEGLLIAALGSLLGLAGGVAYAALMLAGLRTWWLAAIVTPFLHLYITPLSLTIGYLAGIAIAFAAIARSVRLAAQASPRSLLAGKLGSERAFAVSPLPTNLRSGKGTLHLHPLDFIEPVLIAIIWIMVGTLLTVRLSEELRAGAFFGVGAFTLAVSLVIIARHLRSGRTGSAVTAGRGNLLRLALRNAARNPGRSTLTVGLVASATFLIVAVSAFRIDPAGQLPRRDSGDGGFALVAESDEPIYHDLNTPEGRREFDFSASDERLLAQCRIYALRVRPGDDASCLNLYQARQPRVLGIPRALADRGGFAWDSFHRLESTQMTPWNLLQDDSKAGDKTPAVLEKNTAMYALHLWSGVGSTYQLPDGRGSTIALDVVGLLNNSIFQGDLLIGEDAFLRRFPDTSGYRFFLVEAPPDQTTKVREVLERSLSDYGFAAETTGDRLAGFLAVQNTYLSTFQSLGSLGLLLGTFGLAAVQLRNVLERRGELAILRATGFRRRSLAAMVLLENSLLLLAGLGSGILAALVALLPHLVFGGATIPWLSLAQTLALVLAAGLLAGLAAVRATVSTPLLAALRSE
jgi:ABC-type antimicrobial peptide transport system permease subunit